MLLPGSGLVLCIETYGVQLRVSRVVGCGQFLARDGWIEFRYHSHTHTHSHTPTHAPGSGLDLRTQIRLTEGGGSPGGRAAVSQVVVVVEGVF